MTPADRNTFYAGYHPTPMISLLHLVPHSPLLACPEAAEELEKIITFHGIDFTCDDTSSTYNAFASLDTRTVRIGLSTIERLWGYVYGYATIIERTTAQLDTAPTIGAARLILLDEDPGAVKAMKLLAWARNCDKTEENLPFENGLPWPTSATPVDRFERLCQTLFVDAIGWIILHEIAHMVLGHNPNDGRLANELVSEERAADQWAFDRMLRGRGWVTEEDKLLFARRSAGIVMALSVFAATEIPKPVQQRRIHPAPPTRIADFLNQYVAGDAPHDWAWWVGIHSLKPYFDQSNVQIPDIEYDTPQDCFRAMLVALQRHIGGAGHA